MIIFDEQTHRYYDENNPDTTLISVTQLLNKHGLAPDYSDVSSEVLKTAIERGVLIHKQISDACKRRNQWLMSMWFSNKVTLFSNAKKIKFDANIYLRGYRSDEQENEWAIPCMMDEVLSVMNFIDYKNSTNPDTHEIESEKIISNGNIAGTLDLSFTTDGGGIEPRQRILADIKTGATIDKTYCAWQLSLYEYLLYPVDRLVIFHLPQGLPMKVIDLTDKRIRINEIERLIHCNRAGLNYKDEVNKKALESIPNDLILKLQATRQKIENIEVVLSNIKKEEKELREKLATQFKKNHVTSIETERVKITYVPPYSKETFDTKTFKEDNADLYKQYAKQTQVKESLRISIKENQEENQNEQC